ncbi:F0F1 ATP synthase subunit B' [Nitratireductor indicus C115]|uniref:ATP synthase subunit b n=1 Tax=Nitratireductor indicus C115 TaxID=1231190 RepID=K2P1W4_9HYPH|nr:F0F1 ATP synthase subunit B [Nitratireductor indicus]EKF41386.1 F0F1 ATP synthase subunit B' [Nitratireductor indicus C115]SFQ72291.1 F-type H+-transporting ATPase subunit b [Nitratireductor indicus]
MFVASAFAASAQDAAEATHTETGVASEGAHKAGFPPFDSSTFPSQLLWLAITFGLFYLFLKRVVLPRIGGILEVRRDRIAQDLDQAARMKEEADQAVAAYEQELAEARKKANVIGQEARDAAKVEADAERRSVEKELEAKLGEAEKRIASIKDAAMRDVGTIAEDTAASIVQELVGGRLDKASAAAAVKAVKQ